MSDADIIDAVRKTREMLLPHWGNVEAHKKPFENGEVAQMTVTDLDLAVERYLRDTVAKLDPSAGFAGEEYGGSREAERFWLCDPIDGTLHFIRGLPLCTVMLALIEEGTVNFSIIYDFVNDELYHARRTEGAYMNGKPIHVSERGLEGAYIALETRTKDGNFPYAKKLREKASFFETATSGSEFTMVASGKFEARICLDPWGKDYDFAPGTLLVEEAGGVVTNIGKTTYDFRDLNLIAANKRVYAALTEGEDAIFPLSN